MDLIRNLEIDQNMSWLKSASGNWVKIVTWRLVRIVSSIGKSSLSLLSLLGNHLFPIIALTVPWMTFLFEETNFFSVYLDFCVFDESTKFKILDRTLGSIKMKFGQILLQFMANISKTFLLLLLQLKTRSKHSTHYWAMSVIMFGLFIANTKTWMENKMHIATN